MTAPSFTQQIRTHDHPLHPKGSAMTAPSFTQQITRVLQDAQQDALSTGNSGFDTFHIVPYVISLTELEIIRDSIKPPFEVKKFLLYPSSQGIQITIEAIVNKNIRYGEITINPTKDPITPVIVFISPIGH